MQVPILTYQVTKKQHQHTIIVGTNKSQFVVNGVVVEPIRLGRFLNVFLDFLPVGHTKNLVDQLFANISTVVTIQDNFSHLYV